MADDAGRPDRAPGARLPDGLAEARLPDGLAEAFDHLGYLRFDQYMELALYAPASGFFAAGGGAGRRGGDFITSPEVGPAFGAVVALHLDELWDRLGRPSPFTIVEGGAGRGALAIAVRAAAPRCAAALHWVMVERTAALRSRQAEHLETVPCSGVPGASIVERDKVRPPGTADASTPLAETRAPGSGPWFSSLADLPVGSFTGAVLANELLDNLPFRVLERRGGAWKDVVVARRSSGSATATDGTSAVTLAEELIDAPERVSSALDALVPEAVEGTRVPWQPEAARWVTDALALVQRGEVIVFDYADSTASIATRPGSEWLRTYRSHERGAAPLEAPGSQDITVEVALDQLPRPDEVTTQAAWLGAAGLDDIVTDAQRRWTERAGIGDLEAMRARSVPIEAAALTDAVGLGAFKVLTWRRGL